MNPIIGKPGMLTTYVSQPRNIFWGNVQDARYIPGPITIDGTLSTNYANTPYFWFLFAGQPFGKVTATGKYATSIIGLTTVAYTSGGTSLTLSPADATALVARVGASSGTFKTVGPPAANGTVAVITTTFSAVNVTTGVVTVTSLGANMVAGSWIQPTDGSETIVTLLANTAGCKVRDEYNTNPVDVFESRMWAGGGIVDLAYFWPGGQPTDTSLLARIKAQIRTNIPGAEFRDDLANS